MPYHKKVLALVADRQGCGTYRILLPYGELQSQGYDIDIDDKISITSDPCTVVGQRISTNGASEQWTRLAKDPNCRLVYEVDDDLFTVEPSNEHAYYFFTHPEIVNNMEENIRRSDLVTVTNEHLADRMRVYNKNVIVLPNYIDESVLTAPRTEIKLEGADVKDFVTIGYTGSQTHQSDFALIKDQLNLLGERHNNVLYVWIGAQYFLSPPQVFLGWFADINEYYSHISFDIGIAPLVNSVFNLSKSYIKALEYAARGIPVVASKVGPYVDFVKHGETGFLAKEPYQFYRYLRDLVNDETMRKEMGANALEYAKQFTIQKNAHRWAEALELRK